MKLQVWTALGMLAMLGGASVADQPPATAMPPVIVTGTNLVEEVPVGPNAQPEWTTRRRFPNTRVYVLPPWQMEFEQWWRGKFPRGGESSHLFQEEIGIGLPHRFQLDLYENWELTADDQVRHSGVQVEGRWALAEWGKLPLNPTLYAEWKFNAPDPDVYELKLLFGETLAPRWHWGLNLVHEQEVSGGRETVWEATQAVSYTVIDERLSAGFEMKLEHSSEAGTRGKSALAFLLGPSLQWRPTRRTHLDLVPLFGVTGASRHVDAFVVFGVDFGREGADGPRAPVSTRSE